MIRHNIKKLIIVIVLLSLALASCAPSPANNTVTVKAMTYAEYAAASDNAKVVIEGYVQAFAYNAAYNSVNMFIQDDDGAYYAYRAVCDAVKAKSLSEGVRVRVTGSKGSYAGEAELQEQCTFEVLSGNKIYSPSDITSVIGDEKALEKLMNQKISVKGLTVTESYDKADGAHGSLYKWDGSGKAGENDDVYFSASLEGNSSLFVVESDEVPEGTDVYGTAAGLSVGDIIDLEGYMYWYNGPNIHVSGISVTKVSKADLEKSAGAMTYDEFLMAADGEPAVIEAYIQGVSVYSEEKGSFSAYLSDADGAYYIKGITSEKSEYDKLSAGTKVRVSGHRYTENGMPLMSDNSSMEMQQGYYMAPAENISSHLDDHEALSSMAGKKAFVKGITFAAFDKESGTVHTVGPNGKVYSFTTAAEELSEGDALYQTLESISPNEPVEITCFVYLDPEPQLSIRGISVK